MQESNIFIFIFIYIVMITAFLSQYDGLNVAFGTVVNYHSGPTYYFSRNDSEWRVFKRIVKISIDKCEAECERRSTCTGAIYQRQPLVCNLLATFSEVSVVKQSGVILIAGFDRSMITDVNVETERGKTECEVFDSVFGLSGSMFDVGSTLKFDGKSNRLALLLICEETGQWEKGRKDMFDDVQTLSFVGDCSDVTGPSGIYWSPEINRPIFCDMDTENGPWMVFQRREDGSVDFYRNWANYTSGFGNVGGEFWMGLQPLHELMSANDYELRIDMMTYNGVKRWARYSTFVLGSLDDSYPLNVTGFYGDVYNSLAPQSGFPFSTYDHDVTVLNCPGYFEAGWWYDNCHLANLNVKYRKCGESCGDNIIIAWHGLAGSLARTEMKVKRKTVEP